MRGLRHAAQNLDREGAEDRRLLRRRQTREDRGDRDALCVSDAADAAAGVTLTVST